MPEAAIRVEGLSKSYRIGERRALYPTLRDKIAAALTERVKTPRAGNGYANVWALKDVSFEVAPGDVLGVIGRNGAGKSTLLKVLSRITEPTEGLAEIRGRVGSLLEVGTGFHPELTGRENIYLNGAVLGMRRREVERQFDAIVSFAEVDRFIDTPVKHYSSGMYLRLAFAVAAHLEPEILLVDEVLAVGDASFQKKCLGRMEDVANRGKTVLLVSHNMAAIQSLCRTCLVIDHGRVEYLGDVVTAIERYHRAIAQTPETASAHHDVAFLDLAVNGSTGLGGLRVSCDEPIRFEFALVIRVPFSGFRLFAILQNAEGQSLMHSRVDGREMPDVIEPGTYRVSLDVPALWLRTGVYSLHAKLICDGLGFAARYVSDRLALAVDGPGDPGAMAGILTPAVSWRVTRVVPEHESVLAEATA
ncbi:MAG TPA: polysaccharide ABC transporter ATP-binding protein [Thermoanaerobaculia bacterium]|nr:polysaccharide ABC transporter ATP-binding protein [Thermoanaerobaculia bacterium]